MKNKDQILLEQVYAKIVLREAPESQDVTAPSVAPDDIDMPEIPSSADSPLTDGLDADNKEGNDLSIEDLVQQIYDKIKAKESGLGEEPSEEPEMPDMSDMSEEPSDEFPSEEEPSMGEQRESLELTPEMYYGMIEEAKKKASKKGKVNPFAKKKETEKETEKESGKDKKENFLNRFKKGAKKDCKTMPYKSVKKK